MKKTLTILFIITCFFAQANISYINFQNIELTDELKTDIDYLFDNEYIFNHWNPTWNYEVSKKKVVKRLYKIKKNFEAINKGDNVEILLLLGDVCHYLYNLDENKIYSKVVEYYQKAIELDTEDYRGYWFMANHYTNSTMQVESIVYYRKAREKLPIIFDNSLFWEGYAYGAYMANMPSTCLYAIDKANMILNDSCYFDKVIGPIIRKRFLHFNPDTILSSNNLWTVAEKGKEYGFVSRPIGVKVKIDTFWSVTFGDYRSRNTYSLFYPQSIIGYDSKKIPYTIMMMTKIAEDSLSLFNYIKQLLEKYNDTNRIVLKGQFANSIALEIKTDLLYEDQGGGHMYIIGIEREYPKYPGLMLEAPIEIPKGNNEYSYFRYNDFLSRYKGKIYYVLMLDACESIHDEAFKVFMDFLENKIIIE